MREDLLGYLLGALEPHEARRVEALLRTDPALRDELAAVERLLRPLDDSASIPEPPPLGLIERTLANLPPLPPMESPSQPTAGSARTPLPTLGMTREPSTRPARRWADWAAGSVAAAVLLSLLLPTLAEGRFAARRNACQDQLRRFGTAITQFVMLNQQQRLPSVAQSGPEAFAGVYAVRLLDAGLLDDPSMRWCPSFSVDQRPFTDRDLMGSDGLIDSQNLFTATQDELLRWQQRAGGDYAYSLGVIEGDHYATPRYEARSSFAVMSDAPITSLIDTAIRSEQLGHDGRGMNVLYEDGRVQFVSLKSLQSLPDHPLVNDRGQVEAGVDLDDAVLAPSWRPPFLGTSQR